MYSISTPAFSFALLGRERRVLVHPATVLAKRLPLTAWYSSKWSAQQTDATARLQNADTGSAFER